MKTTVSLPDELFRQAETTAKNLRVSRSKLYAAALTEYLNRRCDESVTERLYKVYSKQLHAWSSVGERDAGNAGQRALVVPCQTWERAELWRADLPEPRGPEPAHINAGPRLAFATDERR
jgi:hypothetical protein